MWGPGERKREIRVGEVREKEHLSLIAKTNKKHPDQSGVLAFVPQALIPRVTVTVGSPVHAGKPSQERNLKLGNPDLTQGSGDLPPSCLERQGQSYGGRKYAVVLGVWGGFYCSGSSLGREGSLRFPGLKCLFTQTLLTRLHMSLLRELECRNERCRWRIDAWRVCGSG